MICYDTLWSSAVGSVCCWSCSVDSPQFYGGDGKCCPWWPIVWSASAAPLSPPGRPIVSQPQARLSWFIQPVGVLCFDGWAQHTRADLQHLATYIEEPEPPVEVEPGQAFLVYNLSVGPLKLVVQTYTQAPVVHFHISPIDGDRRGSSPAPPKVPHHLLCLHHIQQQAVLISIVQIHLWISLPVLEVRCGEEERRECSSLCSSDETFRHTVLYKYKLWSVSDSPWSMRPGQNPPARSPACGTHKETLVRAFHCTPLWQYYVWERRTLICPLWRKEHFSDIFSPLELYNWSGVPPIPLIPFSPCCHQPPSDCLCYLPKWGTPRAPYYSRMVVVRGHVNLEFGYWVMRVCVFYLWKVEHFINFTFSPIARSYGWEKKSRPGSVFHAIGDPRWRHTFSTSWRRVEDAVLWANCNTQTIWLGPCPPWIRKLFSEHDGGVTLKWEVQETQS